MNLKITELDNSINPKPVRNWLFACAFMVFAMIVIGAITRLTESGLSMVEWKPLIGAIPPLSDAEWNRVFDLYKQSPEFIKKNFWMELPDFKNIFFWEWLHRLWGRLIGLVFALPLAFFWLRGLIPHGYKLKLIGLLLLGGAQGFMGWYMVKSGLIDNPAVSHYRLAAHLSLALLILACLLWLGLSLAGIKRHPSKPIFIHALVALCFVTVTIFWGAFTAGLDAGLIYNDTFPKMGGQWIPPDFWAKNTLLANILENHSAVQFAHRWLGIATAAVVFSLWLHSILKKHSFPTLHALMVMICVQIALGITTLFTNVNIHVAATHQAGAVIVLCLLISVLFQSRTTSSSMK